MVGRKIRKKYFDTNKVYEEYYPKYKNLEDDELCITKVHYRFYEKMVPSFLAVLAALICLVVATFDDKGIIWFIGIVLVIIMLPTAYQGRVAAVHLCIIEKVEKEKDSIV